MEIDFVAFYDQDEGTLRFNAAYPIKTEQLVRGLMVALQDLANECPHLTARDLARVTRIRVLIQLGEGNFGQGEPLEGPDGGAPPDPGTARWGGTPGAWLP